MPDIDHIKNQLQLQAELCEKILKLTEDAVFTGDLNDAEQDTDRFEQLYEDRQTYVDELVRVTEAIDKLPSIDGIEQLLQEAKKRKDKILARVIELDKQYKAIAESLYKDAKEHIRRINQGRNQSLRYGDIGETDGFNVDSKN